jgi:Ran GTPase-activating protein (RanGAP) involved in mRNA processing and transport
MHSGVKHNDWPERLAKRFKDLTPNANSLRILDLSKLGMNWGYAKGMYREELKPFLHVEEIDLSSNYIDMVAIDFGQFKNLKTINLGFNAFWYWGSYGDCDLGAEVDSNTVEHLKLNDCGIGCIWMRKPSFDQSLISLDLSYNTYNDDVYVGHEYPKLLITRLPKLKWLSLAGNAFPFVSKLNFAPALEELDLSNNPIVANCGELLKLKHLKRLRMCFTELKKIPRSFLEMTYLERLDLKGHQFESGSKRHLERTLSNTEVLF